MLSHKHKCIFVHIPKCGGTSIENLIWPEKSDRTTSNLWMGLERPNYNKYQTGGLQHLLASQIRQEVGDTTFNSYFKFAIVRNPWDKAVSQFEYMKKRKDLREFIGMSEDDTFKKYLYLIQDTVHVQWESQHKFLLDEAHNQIVDYIGRFETFENAVNAILDKLGFRRTLFGINVRKIPHSNKGQRASYKNYYDSESKKIIDKVYEYDIDLLKYSY